MARDRFIALAWRSGEVSAVGTSALVRGKAALETEGWRLVHQRPGLWVLGCGNEPVRATMLGAHGGVVLGDLFEAQGALAAATLAPNGDQLDSQAVARWLSQTHWGRYVALAPDRSGDWSVFRDPLGGLDAFAWRHADVVVVASDLPDGLLHFLAEGLALDWTAITAVAADPPSVQMRSLIRGIEAVGPGELLTLAKGATRRQAIWTAEAFAQRPLVAADLAERLVATLDLCIGAWARAYGPILAEVSGGLDSAIVATALTGQGADVKAWCNHHIAAEVGDERPYARAIAKAIGAPLTEVDRKPLVVSPHAFLDVADGLRPSFNAADAGFDEIMTEMARRRQVRAIVTGQGGDVVFFQMDTPDVAADRFRRAGFAALSPVFLTSIANWTQLSVWTVLRHALGWPSRGGPTAPSYLSARARRAVAARAPGGRRRFHHLPPGKRLQVNNLAYIQVVRGKSRRGGEAAVLHPLLSQPIVELCLRIPSDRLVVGGRARGLARDAFAGRLPSLVAHRRTKGDMTAFYGHAIADGLPAIRAFLLDGRLAAEEVVDRQALDGLLTIEHLAHAGGYGEVFDLLAIEAWVRTWEARLASVGAPAGGPINGARKAKTSAQ